MDEDDASKDGGTGHVGPNPSNDATACQNPTHAGIPAWMLARNNSVHAPVFGQPSVRKSSSRKPPKIPVSIIPKADTALPHLPQLQSRDVASEPKVSPPPLQPRPLQPPPSVELDMLDDDQALALLLKNETVAGLLQNAFKAHVEEHQQKLDRAYNQRLLELEEYTRSWRDTLKELWSAIGEGTVKPDNNQQETLLWKGPQDSGRGFHPDLPTAPQEIVEKEIDPDGRVACISIKASGASRSPPRAAPKAAPKVALQEWIRDTQGRESDFHPFGRGFWSVARVHVDERLMVRITDKYGDAEYRHFRSIHKIETDFSKRDVFIELSPANIALLGKAFCYLKDRRDYCFPQFIPNCDLGIKPGNARHFYKHFSSNPAEKHIYVLSVAKQRKKRRDALKKDIAELDQRKRRLLIARPCFNKDGEIDAASFLDVGNDMRTTRQDNEEAIVLFEDNTTLNRIAQVLEFSLSLDILPSKEFDQENAPQELATAQAPCGNELNDLKPTVIAPISQQSDQSPGSNHRAEISVMWKEWATDIRGTADDFIFKVSKGSLVLRSPHIAFNDFAILLGAAPICGRLYFRFPGSRQKFEYFSWTGTKHKANPKLKTLDIIIELSIPNVVLFWKAFCILKDREECVLARSAKPGSDAAKRDFDDFHERLVQRYYDFSLFKQYEAEMIQSVSLPLDASSSGICYVYDGQADGKHASRRLVLARPYRRGQRVVGAEFFDVGSSTRTGRFSSDIILTEDIATLQGIGRLLEHALLKEMFPSIKQYRPYVTKGPLPVEASPSTSASPHLSVAEEPVSEKVTGSPWTTPKVFQEPDDMEPVGPGRSTSRKRLTPPQALLFQRTIALSDGLKKLNGGTCHDIPRAQDRPQGLAIGGEPEEVRSLSPPLQQDTFAISRRLAPRADLVPVSTAEQEILGVASEPDAGSCDLIMLDVQPKDFTASRREKHSLSPLNRGDSTAKRLRLDASEGSVGQVELLSQDVSHGLTGQIWPMPGLIPAREISPKHLDKLTVNMEQPQDDLKCKERNSAVKDFVAKAACQESEVDRSEHELRAQVAKEGKEIHMTNEPKRQILSSTFPWAQSPFFGEQDSVDFETLPLPSAVTARQLHKLRMQLRELENHLQDNVDQLNESTIGSKIQKIENLRIDIERFEGVLQAQHEFEERREVSNNLRPGAQLSSLGVSHPPKASLNYSNSLFREPEGLANTQKILTGQNESTPTEGMEPFFERVALEASAAPKESPCTIPTEPKAFRGVPTEPRAMRTATPYLQKPCWQHPSGPRATAASPIPQYQASEVAYSPNTAPRSIAEPNQDHAANSLIHSDDTDLRIVPGHHQPLRAVASSPSRFRGDDPAEPAI